MVDAALVILVRQHGGRLAWAEVVFAGLLDLSDGSQVAQNATFG